MLKNIVGSDRSNKEENAAKQKTCSLSFFVDLECQFQCPINVNVNVDDNDDKNM